MRGEGSVLVVFALRNRNAKRDAGIHSFPRAQRSKKQRLNKVKLSALQGLLLAPTMRLPEHRIDALEYVEAGEMRDFRVLQRNGDGRLETTGKITRFFNVMPDDAPSHRHLVEAGERARNAPYQPRAHPKRMKLQSLPVGFETDLIALKKSIEAGHRRRENRSKVI